MIQVLVTPRSKGWNRLQQCDGFKNPLKKEKSWSLHLRAVENNEFCTSEHDISINFEGYQKTWSILKTFSWGRAYCRFFFLQELVAGMAIVLGIDTRRPLASQLRFGLLLNPWGIIPKLQGLLGVDFWYGFGL